MGRHIIDKTGNIAAVQRQLGHRNEPLSPDDMTPHGVPGRMRGFVADIGYGTDLLPFLIDYQWGEPSIAVVCCYRRKEEGG
jgi:hypothetical protein